MRARIFVVYKKTTYTMEFFTLSIDKIVFRYFLMMAAVIVGVFTGQFWLAALGLPIFLSAILGLSFTSSKKAKKSAALRTVKNNDRNLSKAA
ncbi:hypothetical protein CEQ90_14665 [Lewinellaceae bacterium SD302]|nr:hypothetical protein CEQ90_14665 [Lewinellaceae bacterium SD302]